MMGYWSITSYATAFCLIPLTVQQYTFIFLGGERHLLKLGHYCPESSALALGLWWFLFSNDIMYPKHPMSVAL